MLHAHVATRVDGDGNLEPFGLGRQVSCVRGEQGDLATFGEAHHRRARRILARAEQVFARGKGVHRHLHGSDPSLVLRGAAHAARPERIDGQHGVPGRAEGSCIVAFSGVGPAAGAMHENDGTAAGAARTPQQTLEGLAGASQGCGRKFHRRAPDWRLLGKRGRGRGRSDQRDQFGSNW